MDPVADTKTYIFLALVCLDRGLPQALDTFLPQFFLFITKRNLHSATKGEKERQKKN
jgi:hypothetical protein